MSRRRNQRQRGRQPGLVALVFCLSFVPIACSDDGEDSSEAEPTVPATIQLVPQTTAKPAPTTTSTTEVEVEVVRSTTTTEVQDAPIWPLTGLTLVDAVPSAHPAMVVKIDNHPKARPQSGLNEADIVFEENVENLTRFAAVFHSDRIDPVGPIRSGRTQDIDLLGSLNRPLFVWSGGNRRVTDAIVDSDLRQISPQAGGPFFRTDRPGPHDLYANMSALYELAPADSAAPLVQFEYRDPDDEPLGEPVSATKISMDNVRVLWEWDESTETFLRFSDDVVHRDTVFDAQVNTNNVIVLFVSYRPSPADGRSPEAQTIGYGEAWVYRAGSLVVGAWGRVDRKSPFVLTDLQGDVIELTPGRTFVELARVGSAVSVAVGVDESLVPYP